MRRRTIRAAIRVALFTVLCLVSMFVLVTVFGQFRFDSRASYSAVFTNVSGLKGGNFVRIAGVEVGKVKDLTLHKDGTVTVDFAIDKGLTLTEGTKAAVRYENLIGDRYLSLEEGPGSVRKLQPGQTIPLGRTSPALDVDALIGGFRPLFRALDPDQVNALSGQLLQVFQGQGGTISSVLAQTSSLTTTLAGRDELIGQVIANLDTVLGTFATHDDQFSEGLDKLSQLVQGLAERKSDIATGTSYIDAAAGSVADLLTAARQPIKDSVPADRPIRGPDHGRSRLRRRVGQDPSRRLSGAGRATAFTATISASTSATRFSRSTEKADSPCTSNSQAKTRDGAHPNDAIHRQATQNQAPGRAQSGTVGAVETDPGRPGHRRLLLRSDSVHKGHVRLRRLLH